MAKLNQAIAMTAGSSNCGGGRSCVCACAFVRSPHPGSLLVTQLFIFVLARLFVFLLACLLASWSGWLAGWLMRMSVCAMCSSNPENGNVI